MGDDDRLDLLPPLQDVRHVWDDNVNPQHVALGEHETAVNDQQPAAGLHHHHVLAYLADSAQRDDLDAVLGQETAPL